jgi:hypothetical protein
MVDDAAAPPEVRFAPDSPLELPVPRADGTQDTALHGGNTGSNPVGDANPAIPYKINCLETGSPRSLYMRNVYFLYRSNAVFEECAILVRPDRTPIHPRTKPPSIGITAPVT